MLQTELEERFTRHGNLLALFCRRDSGPRARARKRSNTCSLTSTRYAANERTQFRTTQDFLRRVAALALPLDLCRY